MTKSQNRILFLLYLALFIYVAMRAFYMSFTYDESVSFKIINGDPIFVKTANHHFLNTWLMQFFSFCFGDSEFSLRLPNVLSFIIYLLYTHKMLAYVRYPLNIFILLPFFLFNPYILDFFSLARGYGLSMAFMTASLFYFFKFNLGKKESTLLRYFILIVFFATLALASNLSLINFYIAALLISFLNYFLKKDFSTIKPLAFLSVSVAAIIPFIVSLKRLFLLQDTKELYFGAGDFTITIKSLIESSFYFSSLPASFSDGINNFPIYFMAIAVLFLLFRTYRSGPYFYAVLLVLLIVAGLYFEHTFFGALYPQSRTGIYLIPLFTLVLSLFISNLISLFKNSTQKISAAFLSLLFGAPLALHLITKLNLYSCSEWRHDSNTKHIAEVISHKKWKNGSTPNVAVTWIFEPTMNYYNVTHDLGFNLLSWYNDEKNDAIYSIDSNNPGEEWKEVEHFPETSSALFYRVKED